MHHRQFANLEFGKWNDIAILRSMPHSLLQPGIVIVEPCWVGIKQFPPFAVISLLTTRYKWSCYNNSSIIDRLNKISQTKENIGKKLKKNKKLYMQKSDSPLTALPTAAADCAPRPGFALNPGNTPAARLAPNCGFPSPSPATFPTGIPRRGAAAEPAV